MALGLILLSTLSACLLANAAIREVSVLVPQGAARSTRLAADEFAKYWELVTGFRPAVSENPKVSGPAVRIGFPVPQGTFDGKTDAYMIKSVGGGTLELAGKNERSLFYAVYDFFERRCGCRWFWDGDVVPKAQGIDITGLDVFERSRFEFRATHFFAHRSLTRFQATHWGPDDWRREIDHCLKSRVNFFMLQIGLDDLFQRAFPDVVPYPDPSVTQPPEREGRPGYDNHSPHWSLEYRGRLRKLVADYAYDRGLIHPAEFGTLTHWFSRTPQPFLDKLKPPFLPQASKSYSEPSGCIWDIRDPKWFDMYWRLTETQLANWFKDECLFTPGFDERTMYWDREKNLRFKIKEVTRYLAKAHKEHPNSRLLIEGWDLFHAWNSNEVQEFIPRLDPETTVIWDYEADASTRSGVGNGRNFTEWGVVGRFPYIFGMLMALERGNDIRLDYDIVSVRHRVIRDDPCCVGYSLWPETSHSDIFAWRFFKENSWRLSDRTVPQLLHEFCLDRYGPTAADFEKVWTKTLPVGMLSGWWTIYAVEVTDTLRKLWNNAGYLDGRIFPSALKEVPSIFRSLAAIDRDSDFARRDSIDLARTAGDRFIVAAGYELARRYRALRSGEATVDDIRGMANAYVAMGEAMARTLALHSDYSLTESLDRLSTIEAVPNKDFEHVLFENAANSYCRTHQAEFAAHWYVDEMRDIAQDVVAAAERGGTDKLPGIRRDRMKELFALPHPIRSQALDFPRTPENYRRTMLDFAKATEDFLSHIPAAL